MLILTKMAAWAWEGPAHSSSGSGKVLSAFRPLARCLVSTGRMWTQVGVRVGGERR